MSALAVAPRLLQQNSHCRRGTFGAEEGFVKNQSQDATTDRKRRPETTPPRQASPPRKIIRARPEHKARRSNPRKSFIPPSSPHSSPDRAPQLVPQQAPQRTPQGTPQQASRRTPQEEPHLTPPGTPRREDNAQLHSAPGGATDSRDRRSRVDQERKVSSVQRSATPRRSARKTARNEKAGPQRSREGVPESSESKRGRRQSPGPRTPVERQQKRGTPKTRNRRRVGYQVFREITGHQRFALPLIPRLPFARTVREVLWKVAGPEYKMQKLALQALHERAEALIVAVVEGSNFLARHARRVTTMQKDLTGLLALIRSFASLQRCLE